jgi:Flp pilus assembly protein TadG
VRRRSRDESGASLVEFALVLPVFLMVVLGMLTGGLASSRKASVAQGVREGARYASTLPTTTPMSTWLTQVSNVTRAAGEGELTTAKPGHYLCVAYIDGAGASTRRVENGSSVVTDTARCIADDGRTGEARVQVVGARSSTLEALVFSRTLVLEAQAVARYEGS